MNKPSQPRKYNLRAVAAQTVMSVLEEGNSLSRALPYYQRSLSTQDRALLQELCFGILRFLPQLEWCIKQLVHKPLKGKKRPIHYLLLVGIYQLIYLRIPPHAVLSETVNGANALKFSAFKGMVNGVLRQFSRQMPELMTTFEQQDRSYLHPDWLLEKIQQAYPNEWQSIAIANNQKPPFWIRINRNYSQPTEYLKLLNEINIAAELDPQLPDAIRIIHPVAVELLPHFNDGWATVQDRSAQAAAYYLDLKNSDHVLDLCAAPGGKTTHILEIAPQANVTAVDSDPIRIERIKQNLTRLKQQATVICGDARKPQEWSALPHYSKILADVPCSATGVIRRHPDIKWLRQAIDIIELVKLQHEILNAIWPSLAVGGKLLYTTCSILPEENQQQIDRFLAEHTDAQLETPCLQVLPTLEGGDGFFYALLTKIS